MKFVLVMFVVVNVCGLGKGMFLGKDRKNSNSVEKEFEESYLKGLGMEVNRKQYSHMLNINNPTQSEEIIYSKVIMLPQDEIKTKLSHLRKTYSHINNNNNDSNITTIDDANDTKPIIIPHEHSVQVISTLT
jgi:hypothetical protein